MKNFFKLLYIILIAFGVVSCLAGIDTSSPDRGVDFSDNALEEYRSARDGYYHRQEVLEQVQEAERAFK